MFSIKEEKAIKKVENRSKFIGLVFSCDSLEKKDEILSNIKKEYFQSDHICFAYAINKNETVEYYFSDDKEPNGTAGLQILNVIKEQNLINVLGIVVRYFGGVKLGVQNLAKAYKDCFFETVFDNKKKVLLKTKCKITCDYTQFNKLRKRIDFDISKINFNNTICFEIYLTDEEIDFAKKVTNYLEVLKNKSYF